MLLHEGQFLDPVVRDMEVYLKSSQKNVSGEVLITLYPKRFELEGINSKYDLMSNRFASYLIVSYPILPDRVESYLRCFDLT